MAIYKRSRRIYNSGQPRNKSMKCSEWDSNPGPTDSKSNTLTARPPCHPISQKFSNNLVEKAFASLLQAFNIFLELASDSANYYGFSVLEHTVKSLCSRPFELKFVRLTHGYIICMAGKLVSGNSATIIKSGLRTNQLKF